MRRVAVTGVSGYIGTLLVRRLAAHPEVEAIVGFDSRPPLERPSKLVFFHQDIATPFADHFRAEQVDAAIHLAFVVAPTRRAAQARRTNIQGAKNLLEAASSAHTTHVISFGSTSSYGAHADNPVPLTEESPLRPNKGFQYAEDKAATEKLFHEFSLAHPETKMTMLRGCPVLGPGGAKAIGAKVFQPVMVKLLGHNPPLQYVHEDDLVGILVRLLEQQAHGTFNVAADGTLRYTEVAHLAKRPMISVPKPVLGAVMDVAWKLRLQSQSNSTGLSFIAHPWVASNAKLKQATGFQYRYSTEETVRSYLRMAKGK